MFKLYNGCPNGELQRHWDDQANKVQELGRAVKDKFGPGAKAKVTYFPLEGKYGACVFDAPGRPYVDLTSALQPCVVSCVEQAIINLSKMKA